MAIVNSRAAIEPKTGKAAIFVNETIHSLIRKLFANNEQGFAYDPNDLSTMFQDAAGTVPVTAVGQAVGLLLDKSKRLDLGKELWDDSKVTFSGASSRLGYNRYNLKTTDNVYSGIVCSATQSVRDVFLFVEFTIESISGGQVGTELAGHNGSAAIGKNRIVGRSNVINMTFKRIGNVDAIISNISVKQIFGNHAYQTTSAARPILQDAPRRIDFDTAEDKLITTLPAQLTGCTVIRSVPGVGVQLLTNQTIPATYEDNKDHCGLIVINRALTPSETSAIAAEFNKRAGV